MRHPAYLAPGLVLAAIGFVVLFGLLVSQGAMARSKQLAALGELASGRAGKTKKLLSRGRSLFVACACERGPAPDPLELKADDLDY